MNPFWSYETTDWHWNIADIPQYTEVVAWMPLPKPYGLEIIYRPHPLLEETLKRTNLWRYEDYKNFLKYLESNNVTIDKNKYIKDTLCHCKKLYCDWASIYILCRDEKLFEVEAIL